MLVGIQYRARPGLEDQLMTALQKTKDSRRRTGAISWRAWHDASDPGRVLEEFVVASWDDHLRQHERVTKREQAHLERVRELTDPDHPVVVTHWLAVSSRKVPGSPPSRRDCRSELTGPGQELTGPGQERPRPENPCMTNWANCVYLVQMASGASARNGAGVNSHGNTASRTLLVLNSLV